MKCNWKTSIFLITITFVAGLAFAGETASLNPDGITHLYSKTDKQWYIFELSRANGNGTITSPYGKFDVDWYTIVDGDKFVIKEPVEFQTFPFDPETRQQIDQIDALKEIQVSLSKSQPELMEVKLTFSSKIAQITAGGQEYGEPFDRFEIYKGFAPSAQFAGIPINLDDQSYVSLPIGPESPGSSVNHFLAEYNTGQSLKFVVPHQNFLGKKMNLNVNQVNNELVLSIDDSNVSVRYKVIDDSGPILKIASLFSDGELTVSKIADATITPIVSSTVTPQDFEGRFRSDPVAMISATKVGFNFSPNHLGYLSFVDSAGFPDEMHWAWGLEDNVLVTKHFQNYDDPQYLDPEVDLKQPIDYNKLGSHIRQQEELNRCLDTNRCLVWSERQFRVLKVVDNKYIFHRTFRRYRYLAEGDGMISTHGSLWVLDKQVDGL